MSDKKKQERAELLKRRFDHMMSAQVGVGAERPSPGAALSETDRERLEKEFIAGAENAKTVGAGEAAPLQEGVFRKFHAWELKPWVHHDRSEGWKGKQPQIELAASIEASGQMHAGLVRMLEVPDGRIVAEIIFGKRRYDACGALGIPFEANTLPAGTPDKVCFKLMLEENENSKNTSEVEKGIAFKKGIEDGVFTNQSDIADSLGVSRQYVSRLVRAAEVASVGWLWPILEPHLWEMSAGDSSKIQKSLIGYGAEAKVRSALEVANSAGVIGNLGALLSIVADTTKPKDKSTRKTLLRAGKKVVAFAKDDKRGGLSISIDMKLLESDSIQTLVTELKELLSNKIGK